MEVSATYLGGVKFEAEARGHRVICDQPVAGGGADEDSRGDGCAGEAAGVCDLDWDGGGTEGDGGDGEICPHRA